MELDITKLFQLETPVFELVFRGSVLYLAILFLMRILPRRTGGELAIMDLIFIFLIADAAAYSLGGYQSITGGLIVILTLMFWNFTLNWLSYYIPFIEKLISAPPLPIIKNGNLISRNMRREYITEDELMDHLRKEGIETIEQIKMAYVEGDGKITIIKKAVRNKGSN